MEKPENYINEHHINEIMMMITTPPYLYHHAFLCVCIKAKNKMILEILLKDMLYSAIQLMTDEYLKDFIHLTRNSKNQKFQEILKLLQIETRRRTILPEQKIGE